MPATVQEQLVVGLCAPVADTTRLTERERALVAYADLLTSRPWEVTAPDITALRRAGFDDLAIHDACTVIAYFAFVNRVADGLGVELEGDHDSH